MLSYFQLNSPNFKNKSWSDSGFFVDWRARAVTYDFTKFAEKPREIEKFWINPLDLPPKTSSIC